MRMMQGLCALIMAAGLALPAEAYAASTAFETQDLQDEGYVASPARGGGNIAITDYIDGVTPYEGGFMALLTPGADGAWTFLSKLAPYAAGDKIEGAVRWLGRDMLPFNDEAYVSVFDGISAPVTLIKASIELFGPYNDSPWLPFTFAVPADGNYTLTYAVRNGGDGLVPSFFLADGIPPVVGPGVPGPIAGAGLPLLIALGGLVLFRRRFAAAKAV